MNNTQMIDFTPMWYLIKKKIVIAVKWAPYESYDTYTILLPQIIVVQFYFQTYVHSSN